MSALGEKQTFNDAPRVVASGPLAEEPRPGGRGMLNSRLCSTSFSEDGEAHVEAKGTRASSY